MNCKRMTFVCCIAIGMALVFGMVGSAAAEPLQPGLQVWLEGDYGVTETKFGPNLRVTLWADQSGNGNDFTATKANAPDLTAAWGPMGMPAVTFSGVADGSDQTYMEALDFFSFTDWTIFAVVQARTSNAAWGGEIFQDYGPNLSAGLVSLALDQSSGHDGYATNRGWTVNARNNANTIDLWLGSESLVANNDGLLPEIITGALDSTARTAYIWSQRAGLLDTDYNGGWTPTDISGNTARPPTIGRSSGALGGITGSIAALLIYDSKLSDADRLSVESYLRYKYIEPIPEPGTLALLVTGVIGLLCYARRKRR